ncbi:MAG TPA: DUF2398 family protein [Chloroflexota bacterium]|nr:DUF2398 family protein [Chloroflexota bacterium]
MVLPEFDVVGAGGPWRTQYRSADLAKAHRLLLERPVLRRVQHRDEYILVARHVDVLEGWHRERTGWPVYYNERAGIIRLRRRPSLVPSGIWEPWKADVVLSSPRDYACLVYLLWYARSPIVLGRGGIRQALLSELSTHLAQRSALRDDARGEEDERVVEPFDFGKRRADYHSLRRALKALEDLGAVCIVDEVTPRPGAGDEGEALIEFTEVVEALIVELDPRAIAAVGAGRPDPLGLEVPVLDEAANPPLRRAWRALLLGPVLLRRDDPPAFQALVGQRRAVEDEADQIFRLRVGAHAVLRASGAPEWRFSRPRAAGAQSSAARPGPRRTPALRGHSGRHCRRAPAGAGCRWLPDDRLADSRGGLSPGLRRVPAPLGQRARRCPAGDSPRPSLRRAAHRRLTPWTRCPG